MAAFNNTQKALHWCFTLNNPSPSSLLSLGPELYTYLVYGREVAPSTGTLHLQGYVCFKSRKTGAQVKKLLPTAHWEVKRGTPLEASNYCKKDGDFVEEGVLPAAQHENGKDAGGLATKEKWDSIWASAKSGNLDDVEAKTRVVHYRTLKQIESDYAVRAPDLDDVCGLWFYGPPGCGKSHHARSINQDYYIKPANKWWDGFSPSRHPVVLLEDLDHSTAFLGHYLKLWADKWSFAAEKKGSTMQIRPKQIVVTSNYSIEELWGSDQSMCMALKRRFKVTRFEPRTSPFSPLSSLAELDAPRAVSEERIVVEAPPGHELHRQDAVVLRETVGDQFEWSDSSGGSVPIYVSDDDDVEYDVGYGVGRGPHNYIPSVFD